MEPWYRGYLKLGYILFWSSSEHASETQQVMESMNDLELQMHSGSRPQSSGMEFMAHDCYCRKIPIFSNRKEDSIHLP